MPTISKQMPDEGIIVERLDIEGTIECYVEADTWFVREGDSADSGTLTLFGARLDDPSRRRAIAVFAPNTWATVRPVEAEVVQLGERG